jgi:hypothetical protein
MNESLLVVEDTHVRGDALVLSPFLPHQPSRKVRVRYETPGGAGGIVDGHVEDAAGKVWDPGRLSPPHESTLVLDVAGLRVPAGTRIWIVEELR